jgi:ABC-2 type transport system ATP-binding protein
MSAVAIEGVGLRRQGVAVLDDVALRVEAGEVVGVIGRNGAGKSTLLDVVAGLQRADVGSIAVLGMTPWRDRDGLTRRVSVQAQDAALLPTLTVLETLRLFATIHGEHRPIEALLEWTGLEAVRDRRAAVLSGGEARRLQLAIALLPRAELVLLDEPTAAVDPAGRALVAAIVRRLAEQGVAVLLATHDMAEAELWCGRVVVLDGGRSIAAGTPAGLLAEHRSTATIAFRVDLDADLGALRALVPDDDLEIVADATGADVRIRSTDADETVRRITFARGFRARGIRVHRGGLGELFFVG